jgi:hypothetical protein
MTATVSPATMSAWTGNMTMSRSSPLVLAICHCHESPSIMTAQLESVQLCILAGRKKSLQSQPCHSKVARQQWLHAKGEERVVTHAMLG